MSSSYRCIFFYLTNASSNIAKIIKEFRERFSDGLYNPRVDYTPILGAEYDIITPDMPLETDCIMGETSLVVADKITWNIGTGMELEGLIYDQAKGAVVVTADEEAIGDGGGRGRGARRRQ